MGEENPRPRHILRAWGTRRELLPARITNRGFPDFDLKEFLAPERASEAEIKKLFESVLKMIEMRHGEADAAVEN
jgi:hypothetical protein